MPEIIYEERRTRGDLDVIVMVQELELRNVHSRAEQDTAFVMDIVVTDGEALHDQRTLLEPDTERWEAIRKAIQVSDMVVNRILRMEAAP